MSNATPVISNEALRLLQEQQEEEYRISPPSVSQMMAGAKHMLPPTGPSNGPPGSFISWLSIAMFVLFVCFLRSSAGPFLNPLGEARKAASSTSYFTISLTLYAWVISATSLTILPHFSPSSNNALIAASLFFPMTFASIGALMIGRFAIRFIFYFSFKSGLLEATTTSTTSTMTNGNSTSTSNSSGRASTNPYRSPRPNKSPRMVAFHRPFRKLAKSAACLSALLSCLHAHCWSDALSVLRIHKSHDASLVCRVCFSPFVADPQGVDGADEQSIWYYWLVAVVVMLVVFAQDEVSGMHCKKSTAGGGLMEEDSIHFAVKGGKNLLLLPKKSKQKYQRAKTEQGAATDDIIGIKRHRLFPKPKVVVERPKDAQPMVAWFSLVAAATVIDIIIQWKIFLGRVDVRTMQPALQDKEKEKKKKTSTGGADMEEDATQELAGIYRGCVFNYAKEMKDDDDDFWFDFMADCGDGFNPSYQIARMLAQPYLEAVVNDEKTKLPRGRFLVNGGDLAYPDPTEKSYETRFFRTFEDALPPPPSYRRRKIATNKPDLPVSGWKDCFEDESNHSTKKKDLLERYKGPSCFLIPGNHDWYDGLATFSRLILCRDWIGGWLMPQERSYFSIKLPQGWWIFAIDCGLGGDIDIEQFKYFSEVADRAVGKSDSVIIINHEPHWVTEFDQNKAIDDLSEKNVEELMRSHLSGKVRLRLAGDLHHYTRHVPVSKKSTSIPSFRRSRSYSFDGSSQIKTKIDQVEPFMEENKPELIVSGGGGAFLHGTHNYAKDIKFGRKQVDYTRVCAYPSEKTSYYLALRNLYNFRARNWRCDSIFAVLYIGIVSSLFPLCGIYAEYKTYNPEHRPILLPFYVLMKVGSLMLRIIVSERVSFFFCCLIIIGSFTLHGSDHKIRPAVRIFVSLSHAFLHITAALMCLLFLQSAAEWVVYDKIITISNPFEGAVNQTGLASSLYGEYETHFKPFLRHMTSEYAKQYEDVSLISNIDTYHVIEKLAKIPKWLFEHIPLLKTTLRIFDLPGIMAQTHSDMCNILCEGGTECLFSHDFSKFVAIPRTLYAPYFAAMTIYFIFLAVPTAGIIFGGWITLSLCVLGTQADLGFSSLMYEHYKNFLKLRVKKNGDLEVYAVGLNKVPTQWVKDPEWDKAKEENTSTPSWGWKRPSKWIPAKENETFEPKIVDHICIPKRRIKT